MIIKINKLGRNKEFHLEYPGSYWEVMNQTSVQPKKKESTNFFGFKSLQHHFSPTKYDFYYHLNSVFTFYQSQPDKRSTLANIKNNQIFIYKFNSMELDQRVLFSMNRC